MDFTMELKNGDKATVQTNQIIRCLRNGVQLDKDFLADVIDNLVYKANEGKFYKRKYETEAERAKAYKKQVEELKKELDMIKISDKQAKEIERLEEELKKLKEENEGEYLKGRIERLVNANKKKVEYISTLKMKHDIETKSLKDKIHIAKMLNKFYRHELKRRGVKFIKMDDGFGHHVNVMHGTEIDGYYLIRTANMTEEELDSTDNE